MSYKQSIIRVFQKVLGLRIERFNYPMWQAKLIKKLRDCELSFLYATCLLNLSITLTKTTKKSIHMVSEQTTEITKTLWKWQFRLLHARCLLEVLYLYTEYNESFFKIYRTYKVDNILFIHVVKGHHKIKSTYLTCPTSRTHQSISNILRDKERTNLISASYKRKLLRNEEKESVRFLYVTWLLNLSYTIGKLDLAKAYATKKK